MHFDTQSFTFTLYLVTSPLMDECDVLIRLDVKGSQLSMTLPILAGPLVWIHHQASLTAPIDSLQGLPRQVEAPIGSSHAVRHGPADVLTPKSLSLHRDSALVYLADNTVTDVAERTSHALKESTL